MSGKLRVPLTWAAFGVSLLIVLVEVGSGQVFVDADAIGWGIPCLAWIDGILCWSLLWRALNYVLPDSLQVKLQVVGSVLGAILYLLAAIVTLFVALQLLLLMLTLVVAVPFGLAIYLAKWGTFAKGTAAATLGVLMTGKLVVCVLLFLADRTVIRHKMLVFTVLLSLLAGVVLAFLHGIVPRPFATITDLLGALIEIVLGIVLGLILLIGSIFPLVKVVLRSAGEVGSAVSKPVS